MNFIPVELVEIAGPGLKFEIPEKSNILPGDKGLVVLELHGISIAGMARVRRVQTLKIRKHGIAVELVDLSEAEIATLTKLTNIFARENMEASRALAG